MTEPDFASLRTAMIDGQLKTTGVSAVVVLAAFAATPRERFVPADTRALAYAETEVQLAPGRAMMKPMLTGLIFQHLALRPEDSVLIVGAGTGYTAAVAALLAMSVVALEELPELAAAARDNLAALGGEAARVAVVEGPLAAGWPAGAPYDALLLDGMIEELPPALIAQCRERARFGAVMRDPTGVARVGAGIVAAGAPGFDPVVDSAAPPLPGFSRTRGFRF